MSQFQSKELQSQIQLKDISEKTWEICMRCLSDASEMHPCWLEENYIVEKYDLVAIKYLKEKILNDVKQQFSPSNQGGKINAELVKSLKEQIENLQSEMFFTRRNERKKYFVENGRLFWGFSPKKDFIFPCLLAVPAQECFQKDIFPQTEHTRFTSKTIYRP